MENKTFKKNIQAKALELSKAKKEMSSWDGVLGSEMTRAKFWVAGGARLLN
jgi:hypothetical protein